MKFILLLSLVALAFGDEEIATTERTGGDGPVIDTHYGKVKGGMDYSREGKMFYQFKGIPYAQAPERFQAPEIPKHWDEIKDATEFGPVCAQYSCMMQKYHGVDDCLNLNVYTPKLPVEGEHKILLPVVVLLHPGGHNMGSSKMYGVKYMMDGQNVIVVTINSRLGLFGYLNTGDMYAQGNMGLKDQSLALKWVQLNIEKFGGDKGRVTLMGYSAGAAETIIHMLSPLSKGLFHNAAVHSGNPMSQCSLVRDPIAQAKKLGAEVGCPHKTSAELVMCLKAMEPLDILKKMKMPDTEDFDFTEMPFFGPSIEKVLEGQTEADVMMAENPVKLLKDGKIQNKVPLVTGITEYDGIMPISAMYLNSTDMLKKLNDNWDELAPKLLGFSKTATDPKEVAKKLKEFYFEGKEVNEDTKAILIQIFTDRYYASTTRFAVQTYSKHAPVYPYFFTYKPEHHYASTYGFKNDMGAGHLDDFQYLFNVPENYGPPEITSVSKPDELKLSKGMVQLWTSFFETGKPTKTWGEGKEWKKLDNPEKPTFFKIDLETKSLEEPESIVKKMNFWQDLYKTELAAELQTPPQETF